MRELTEEMRQKARAVYDATDKLNEAVKEAVVAGLIVELRAREWKEESDDEKETYWLSGVDADIKWRLEP